MMGSVIIEFFDEKVNKNISKSYDAANYFMYNGILTTMPIAIFAYCN